MMPLPALAGALFAAIAGAGIVQAVAGAWACHRFAAMPRPTPRARPPVTVLKPLHGDEPGLRAALETFFTQGYPEYQLVFGVQSPTDPAIAVVRQVMQHHPETDATLIIDDRRHGLNRKIGNVLNMLPAAKHPVLVVADSDVFVTPDYLDHVIAALESPGIGVVTTLYAGLPGRAGLVGRLGASHISHTFLPGALLARWLGRQDCLGATMALHRDKLRQLGGFEALVDFLADDSMLGLVARRHGYGVALAPIVPRTTVPEQTLPDLFQHELRWARTIRSLAPVGHALSLIQYPVVWASLALLVSGFAVPAWLLLGAALAARGAAAASIDHSLGLAPSLGYWQIGLRDFLSAVEGLASLCGARVRWRGEVLLVGRPRESLRAHAQTAYRGSEQALGQG